MEWKKSESENGLEGAEVTIAGFKTISGKNGYYSVRIPAGLDSVDADVDHGLIYPRRTKLFLPSGKLDINVVDTLNFSKKLMGVYNKIMGRVLHTFNDGELMHIPAYRFEEAPVWCIITDTTTAQGKWDYKFFLASKDTINAILTNPDYPQGFLYNSKTELRSENFPKVPYRCAPDGYFTMFRSDDFPSEQYAAGTLVDVTGLNDPKTYILAASSKYRPWLTKREMDAYDEHEELTAFTNAGRIDVSEHITIFNWGSGTLVADDLNMLLFHYMRHQSYAGGLIPDNYECGLMDWDNGRKPSLPK